MLSVIMNAWFSFAGIALNHSMVSLVLFHRFPLVNLCDFFCSLNRRNELASSYPHRKRYVLQEFHPPPPLFSIFPPSPPPIATFMSHRRQPEVKCFLFWRAFAP